MVCLVVLTEQPFAIATPSNVYLFAIGCGVVDALVRTSDCLSLNWRTTGSCAAGSTAHGKAL